MPSFGPEREQVVAAARRLSARGYLVATGGNLSVRIPGQAAFAITPTNLDYGLMTADDVCVLDLSLAPRFDRHARTQAVLLATEVHQVFGTWSGTIVPDGGGARRVEGLQGFAEESRSRW